MAVCPRCRCEAPGGACERCDAPPPAHALLRDGTALPLAVFAGTWPDDPWRYEVIDHHGRLFRAFGLDRDWFTELRDGLAERAALDLPCLPPIEVIECDGRAVVLVESGRPASLPPVPEGDDEKQHLDTTLTACALLADAMRPLHRAGLAWLTFDPDVLEAGPRIANLDLQLHRAGTAPPGLRLPPAYAAPEVMVLNGPEVGPASDVFSLALYAYYRLAGLMPDGFPGEGPAAFDFDFPPLRVYRPWLPAGIAPVIERSLARSPGRRHATPDDLIADLRVAVVAAQERYARPVPVRLEHAAATRPGIVHTAAGVPNQDACAVVPLTGGTAFIVADGITHALIGSGDLASQTAVATLRGVMPAVFRKPADLGERADALSLAFERASEAVLARALAQPLGRFATDPTDLMSTTAVVAVIHGREMLLGNVGDSRAYLVRDGQAEQLTVDGDLRCVQLASGVPPEKVRDMGPATLALYRCIGVSQPGPEGGLILDPDRSRPDITYWPLLPGDVVVLCTDGLVEEGAFLSPDELPGLIDAAPAAQVVERLVSAASARHVGPNELDPLGCGDDVTCVLIRVLPVEG